MTLPELQDMTDEITRPMQTEPGMAEAISILERHTRLLNAELAVMGAILNRWVEEGRTREGGDHHGCL